MEGKKKGNFFNNRRRISFRLRQVQHSQVVVPVGSGDTDFKKTAKFRQKNNYGEKKREKHL